MSTEGFGDEASRKHLHGLLNLLWKFSDGNEYKGDNASCGVGRSHKRDGMQGQALRHKVYGQDLRISQQCRPTAVKTCPVWE